MKNNIIINLMKVLLYIIILLLICLIIFFGIYVYNREFKNRKQEIIDIYAVNKKEDIITTKLPEQNEEINVVSIKPQVEIQSNSNMSNSIDKFYYNQLDKYSKLIYDALNNNKESLKTGIAKIDLDKEIGELLKTEEGMSKIEGIFNIAINAFEYDNPQVFYIDASKMVLYYEIDSLGNCNAYIKNYDENNDYLIEGFNNKEDIDRVTQQIETIIKELINNTNDLNNNYEKIKYIHDWIVENTKYDETLSSNNRNNIYGLLVEKNATCGGYAKAFKYIMDKININSIIVQGKAKQEETSQYHAWNYIQVDNEWYGIDCTWDDPIVIGISDENKQIYYNYFLKGQNSFENHVRFDTFYGTDLKINYPKVSTKDY